ncbi:hypothetical protein AVEN_132186-1, partial [Araneus ventricosus]
SGCASRRFVTCFETVDSRSQTSSRTSAFVAAPSFVQVKVINKRRLKFCFTKVIHLNKDVNEQAGDLSLALKL